MKLKAIFCTLDISLEHFLTLPDWFIEYSSNLKEEKKNYPAKKITFFSTATWLMSLEISFEWYGGGLSSD